MRSKRYKKLNMENQLNPSPINDLLEKIKKIAHQNLMSRLI